MDRYRGIVFFDVDGTLIHASAGITRPTQATMDAIRTLKKNGYLTAAATGRAECYFVPGMEELDAWTCTNGSYTVVNGTVIDDNRLTVPEIRMLDRVFTEMGINYMIENPRNCYVKDPDDPYFEQLIRDFDLPRHVILPFSTLSGPDAVPFYKFIVMGPKERINALRAELGERYDITGTPAATSCDFCRKGVNKAFGAALIMNYLGFTGNNSYAFGDAPNDHMIFRMVGHGVAMGLHSPDLEEVAEYITGTVEEEGIRQGLLHYGLI